MANYRFEKLRITAVRDDGIKEVSCEIWAASTADVPAYDALGEDKVIIPGSVAVVPSEGKLLIMDFDNAWKEWGEG